MSVETYRKVYIARERYERALGRAIVEHVEKGGKLETFPIRGFDRGFTINYIVFSGCSRKRIRTVIYQLWPNSKYSA